MGFKIENGVLLKYTENVFSKSDVTVPDTVKKIAAKAFGMCSGIKSITLPVSVTEIGNEAFKGCSSLESVNLPGGITKIGAEAFRNCSSLKSITIPVGITEIREYMFCNCSSLKSVSLPAHIKTIELHSFYGCKSLESIRIPNSVVEISDFAFCGCLSLVSAVLPESIVKIGSSAFWGCCMLENINLPGGLKEIGDYAFKECTKLANISIPDGIEKVGKEAFIDCPALEIALPKDHHNIRGSLLGYKIKTKEETEKTEVESTSDIEEQKPSPTQKTAAIKGFTQLTKQKYYSPGTVLITHNIRGYDISCTTLTWERVPVSSIEAMIDTGNYYADMYLPMKYSIVAAVFIKDRLPGAASFIWNNTIDVISYFISVNDYYTVKELFESGKFITSRNIMPLLECAIDKAQSGGDRKIEMYINNYYLLNSDGAKRRHFYENYSQETRDYLHTLDIMENRIGDIRMLIEQGADRSEISNYANELFGVFMDFRASLPDELSQLFNSYSTWSNQHFG